MKLKTRSLQQERNFVLDVSKRRISAAKC